jgi:cytochrome c oxidase subunit 3
MATIPVVSKKSIWYGGLEPFKASYGKLMMWFFLLSDALTFSGLLITYAFSRFSHPKYVGDLANFKFSADYWPVPEKVFTHIPFFHIDAPLVFVGIMTFILIMSSVTMVLAVEAGHRMDKKGVMVWMFWTILGGIAFLSCQAWEWTIFITGIDGKMATMYGNPYGPTLFANLFFTITGFHGTHVLSGVIVNIIVFYNTGVGIYEKTGHYEMVEKVGLYWHFVDLVWVFVFTFFYLI